MGRPGAREGITWDRVGRKGSGPGTRFGGPDARYLRSRPGCLAGAVGRAQPVTASRGGLAETATGLVVVAAGVEGDRLAALTRPLVGEAGHSAWAGEPSSGAAGCSVSSAAAWLRILIVAGAATCGTASRTRTFSRPSW